MREAASSAPSSKVLGYDQPGPASMYRARMEQVFPTDYPVLFWLRPLSQPDTRLFDLGGHVGVSYYAYEKYINFPERFSWQVCDVQAVTEAGIELAKEHQKSALSFTNQYSDMDGADIVLASGSLQYIEQDLSDIIQKLSKPPSHVLINLLPVHADHAFVTLQNIGTAYCPYRIFNEDEFIGLFRKLGFELRDKWINPEKSCDIPFHEEYSVKPYSGFYFTRRC